LLTLDTTTVKSYSLPCSKNYHFLFFEVRMTQQKNFFSSQLSGDSISRFFEGFQVMPFDLQSILETQRKNLQCLSEAQQLAMQNWQTLFFRQAEIFSQAMEKQSALTSELMKEGKPEDKLAKNAEAIKQSYEQAMANAAEISDMVKKANAEATSLLNKRVSASLKEMRSAIAKPGSEKDAA
jgi:phasin family protein